MRIAALDDDALQLELIQRATAAMGHMCHPPKWHHFAQGAPK